ncbi:hypothetical protein Rhe02_51600 [Rhizocola hellebori]|uniref:CBM2 domain-containing protein n=1 Tax=Rhizocola hellebori TaxID=1392758 RepID=A0A8J3VIM9_9ACTN|nr:SRPBCC domain-containing protein [Rhizocola hellebori]GIH07093.1 hypothetical protein Rhe02_51600 [Rhizocola hellebori]
MGDVQTTVDLPYPAEVVWKALTDRRWLGEWFMPTDLEPVAGGAYRAFPPPGLSGFTAAFAIDVVTVLVPQRLVMRFRGEQLHAEVSWELTETGDGSRLLVSQTGFLGLESERRRAEILGTYEFLFQQRLPVLLERLAAAEVAPAPEKVQAQPVVRAPLPVPQKIMPKEKPRWRVGVLSILGAMILTVLIASTFATMMLSQPDLPAAIATSARGPATAVQPGVSATGRSRQPTPSRAGRPGPSASASLASPLLASYRTDSDSELGYIGAITIQAGPQPVTDWTATVELPQGATVTSAWDQIDFRQNGRHVTFTPGLAHQSVSKGAQFTFFFQVGEVVDLGMPIACSVNEVPCAGLV